MPGSEPPTPQSPLERARRKAYARLIPLLLLSYMIAYIDRGNVSFAKLEMFKDYPAFNDAVIGAGAGIFFIGYFLLEIPGTLLVERWSARKWISRIMITWGIVAALTAFVRTPTQFYTARFLLGLAEAGFFPGVIVYLTHWFPSSERTKALAWFLIATPIAQILSPFVAKFILPIGRPDSIEFLGYAITLVRPKVFGLVGWQCLYIFWGIPAVVLGFLVFFYLTDRPRHARWLEPDEREALEAELEREKQARKGKSGHMTVFEALKHPKVLMLAAAYFFVVMGNYGVEFFMPSIIKEWFSLNLDTLTWFTMIPPVGSLLGQLFVGWNSDRTKERRLHAAIPILMGGVTLLCTLLLRDKLWACIFMFTFVVAGTKAYLPAFWALPSLFLTEAAAAGSIGFINSFGNLGGFFGPYVVGQVHESTKSFLYAIIFLSCSMAISAVIVFSLGLGKRPPAADLMPKASLVGKAEGVDDLV